MKKVLFSFILASFLWSCASVVVNTDFDRQADFSQKKTFAFYKEGVDRVEISDLDKKRILRNIEKELVQKGFVLNDTNPDILVNFFTKEERNETYYNNVGFGWGWGPFSIHSGQILPSTRVEGTLFIDILDGNKKDLIWQGKGVGAISSRDKEETIQKFVSEILKQYPPKNN